MKWHIYILYSSTRVRVDGTFVKRIESTSQLKWTMMTQSCSEHLTKPNSAQRLPAWLLVLRFSCLSFSRRWSKLLLHLPWWKCWPFNLYVQRFHKQINEPFHTYWIRPREHFLESQPSSGNVFLPSQKNRVSATWALPFVLESNIVESQQYLIPTLLNG